MVTSHWILKQYWRPRNKTSHGDDFKDVGHPVRQLSAAGESSTLCSHKHYGKGCLVDHCFSQRQNTSTLTLCYILPLLKAVAPRLCLPDALSSEPGVLVSYGGTTFSL